ncbi:lipid IV(A) 3-deoxy-D-manno-octulosonic acid transferase [Vibrio sp. Hal054]|uniref:lipid IV(A) 3-deoxy-D-manno-octulosonic acid transferase n=1 Tax=Vibrio sp. Hal054 TaxID=3035158 RepID=UPI00301C3D4F
MFIRWLYTLILVIASPFLIWGLYKKQPGKPSVGSRWKEHFGFTPPLPSNSKSQLIWVHAVSVGETLAVAPLLKRLKLHYPQYEIVITTTTPTGAEQAEKLEGIAHHRYMPFDFPFAIRGFINAIKPSQLLIMETELWPNTLHTVAKADIPITVINARLSERSCQRYAKVQPVFDMLAKNLTQVLCQYPDDAERFIRLGVAKEKVSVTGSIKFDIDINEQINQNGQTLRRQLGTQRPIWIAASTHPGEDEQILAAHKKILVQHSDALLILVPRHPERFNAMFKLAQKQFVTVRRTESGDKIIDASVQVYLGDTMGEMLTLISAADICFMGGSLLGDKVGGHNLLEPAALAKPILTGPSFFNFKDITDSLIENGSTCICHSSDELKKMIILMFSTPELIKNRGQNAIEIVNSNKGALQKTLTTLKL